jgi:adenine C2-methylase RlmN of 23S rRNA A2503 and tRNA A37
MKTLLGMTIEELKQFAAEIGEKPFRGKQIFVWLSRGATSFDEMTDLPKSLREKLKECAQIGGCRAIRIQEDTSDGTRKRINRRENQTDEIRKRLNRSNLREVEGTSTPRGETYI